MPRTRAQGRVAAEEAAVVAPKRVQYREEAIPNDEEEDDIGKTLCAKDGKLGFMGKKGFFPATNFLVDIESQVSSDRYSIKGLKLN